MQLMTELLHSTGVGGIVEMAGNIYVAGEMSSTISVFTMNNRSMPVKTIRVNNMMEPRDIVACHATKRLFISDFVQSCIFVLSDEGRQQMAVNTQRPLKLLIRYCDNSLPTSCSNG